MFDEDHLPAIFHLHDQSVGVAFDVEHGIWAQILVEIGSGVKRFVREVGDDRGSWTRQVPFDFAQGRLSPVRNDICDEDTSFGEIVASCIGPSSGVARSACDSAFSG